MCGIAGFFNVNISLNLIQTMADSISHRGPDNQSSWFDMQRHISFGHTRLAIVDKEGGNQPMTDTFGRFTIVFNGEIYGFKSLREKYKN
jgi:asparagine synthase (glutamine-hydrolysing)